jgi:cysteine desulfurase family protein (TIGR01976 family)
MTTTTTAAGRVDAKRIRRCFPALSGRTVFLENAGGSQVPAVVADAVRDYMLESYVQLGAGYELSQRCTALVDRAHEFMNLFVNGIGRGKVILGPSCTQLCTMLADCYARRLDAGDEIIVTETGHEANVGPWMKLADRGFVVRMWNVDPDSLKCPLDRLDDLLTDRTKLVAIVHASNLLGEIIDVKPIAARVHEAGARLVVDGVAYAPHRAIDVAALGADWYVFSNYKVYGPHMATLFGADDAIAELEGPNHFFIPRDEVPYKFELGGASHEACAGLLALGRYLAFVASGDSTVLDPERDVPVDRAMIDRAFATMTACELPLQCRLIGYLRDKPQVRIVGPDHAEPSRVGTISFVHETRSSAEITAAVNARNIGIRNGHMYAYRLCRAIGLDPDDGVVRVSLVHYNTIEEIERLIAVLDEML